MFCELLLCIQKLCVLFGLLGFRDCVFCQMLLYIWKLCVFLNFVELPKCFVWLNVFEMSLCIWKLCFFCSILWGFRNCVFCVKCRLFC